LLRAISPSISSGVYVLPPPITTIFTAIPFSSKLALT
jgi:hypothetical protein